ncbi:acyltransferase family protein [Microlunatus speluncae]|uniref:acyltransferase family protein n=1 Tax=Microlunatus speluncae TaxID=2594267 RepID=UPI0012664561|nr:acyltransferase family protein [Microlunatus speluncae]
MPVRTTDPRHKVRDASLDNAKAILIVLVVLGHAIEEVPKDELIEGLYRAIYLFHMPAFALITGYLSRRFQASVGSYLKLLGTLLVPYLVFQVGHAAIVGWLDEKPIAIDLLYPEWTLWYLLAVAFWRVLTPIFRALPFAIPVSFLIALGCGLLPDLPNELALDRTITLLPFFVIGLAFTPEGLDRIRRFGAVPLGVIFVPVAVAVSWWSLDQLGADDFWFRQSFIQMADESTTTGLLLRLAGYAFGLLGTAWVLALGSRRKSPLTYIGVNSLYVYLLHSVVLLPFRDNGVIEGPDEPWLLIMSIAFAIGLSALLASKPVTVITRLIVQPPFNKIGKSAKPVPEPEPAPEPKPAPTLHLRPIVDLPTASSRPPIRRTRPVQAPRPDRRSQPIRRTQPARRTPASPPRRARLDDDELTFDRRVEVRPRRAADSASSR